MKRIIIVGAGAAGMLAAIHAKTKDNQVILIERNTNCGKKILITGNGKCNYLNDDFLACSRALRCLAAFFSRNTITIRNNNLYKII